MVGLVAAWALGSALALPRTGSVATAVLLAGLAVLAVVVPGLVAAGAAAGPAVLGVLTWRLLQFWLPIPLAPVCWLSLELGRRSDRSGRTDDPVPKAR